MGEALGSSGSLRTEATTVLSGVRRHYARRGRIQVTVRSPEEHFRRLLEDDRVSLLALENVLAESVDALIICPESPGSYAELGAFVNRNDLLPKIIVISELKYKNRKSFLRRGPEQSVLLYNSSNVHWIERGKTDSMETACSKILHGLSPAPLPSPNGIFVLQSALLIALYVFESLSSEVIHYFCGSYGEMQRPIAKAIREELYDKQFLVSKSSRIALTSTGLLMADRLVHDCLPRQHRQGIDALRLRLLNSTMGPDGPSRRWGVLP